MRNSKRMKVLDNILLLFVIVSLFCVELPAFAEESVKVTSSEYEVYLSANEDNMLCNKKSAGNKIGTEYYLTYTVESATDSGKQNGLVGTCDPQKRYPYSDGKGVLYAHTGTVENPSFALLDTGYTYFIKYVVTKTGFRYTAAKAKGSASEYLVFQSRSGDERMTENCGWFGLWFAIGKTNAHLTHVRFYDKDGNDLGLMSPRMQAVIKKAGLFKKADKVKQRYTIRANGINDLAISNEKPLTGNRMYIEYTVKSDNSTLSQNGIAYSNSPDDKCPHAKGSLRYSSNKEAPENFLLDVGAEYLIFLEKNANRFTALIQKKKNGKTETLFFPNYYGEGVNDGRFFSLWFGDNVGKKAEFVLENVKFYDENYNNLGIRSNVDTLSVRYYGPMLDYTGCEAVYYCKENKDYYVLYKDKKLNFCNGNVTEQGTYSIAENVININLSGKSENAEYLYRRITDHSGNVYERLYTYTVDFVTGKGSKVDPQIMNIENGYNLKKPKDPTLKGNKFICWCLADGKEFDFNQTILESATLYAKWSDGDGNEFISVSGDTSGSNKKLLYSIGICTAIILISVAAGTLILKWGKQKNAKQQ